MSLNNEALKIVKLVILITDTLSLNVVISLAGDLRPGHGNTDAAERSYSAQAALCF